MPQVEVPRLPAAPDVGAPPAPRVEVPAPPDVPSTGGSLLSGGGSGEAPAPGYEGGSSEGAAGGDNGGRRSGRASSRERARAVLRRFADGGPELRRCLGLLGPVARAVVVLRAGLGEAPRMTTAQVARRLDLSARGVRRVERRAVRTLTRPKARDRCGDMDAVGAAGGGSGPSMFGRDLDAVGDLFAAASGPGAAGSSDEVAVKAASATGGEGSADGEGGGGSGFGVGIDGEGGPIVWLLILVILASLVGIARRFRAALR